MRKRSVKRVKKQGNQQRRSLRAFALYFLLAVTTVILCCLTSPVLARPSLFIAQAIPESPDPNGLLQQGRDLYGSGHYSDAIPLLQQAIQTYQEQRNYLQQALTLSNLSLVYQELGQWGQGRAAITQSLAIINALEPETRSQRDDIVKLRVLAQALDIQGRLQMSLGRAAEALNSWKQAADIYEKIEDQTGKLESQLRQVQALEALGLHRRVTQLLEQLTQNLNHQSPSIRVLALRSLGDALLITGELYEARQVLNHALEITQELSGSTANEEIAATKISFGILTYVEAITNLSLIGLTPQEAIAQLNSSASTPVNQTKAAIQKRNQAASETFYQQTEVALDLYQQAIDQAQVSSTQIRAELNQLRLLIETQRWSLARDLYPKLQIQLQNQPPNHNIIYNQIEFAQSLIQLLNRNRELDAISPSPLAQSIVQILSTAYQQSISIGDRGAQSYALGALGEFYEKAGRLTEAKTQTQRALGISQATNSEDISYRWQWQLGRILKLQGDVKGAIDAYETAFSTLQALRRDVVTANLSYQLAFREDTEEPIYRELISLRLLDEKPSQENLKRSREVATSLQVAKLENFLGEPCADVSPELIDNTVDRLAARTAVIYPIILSDRLEIIVKLPQEEKLYHFRSEVSLTDLFDVIQILQIDLEKDYTFDAIKVNSNRLYKWLLEPVRERLEEKKIDTLVFALDGPLRSIPIAALYDGQKYLVETYATAVTLGLDLQNPAPLRRQELSVLAAGLTDPPKDLIINAQDLTANFARLPNVGIELEAIEASGVIITSIPDENFTKDTFNSEINQSSFPIVHLATHGQFTSDPKSTFLLTSDGAIAVDDLKDLFQVRGEIRPDIIELLILNACETAAGDQLAALGIAGTAFRAGTRSVIASLWTLDDTSSVEFTRQFYQNLVQSEISKAEALRLSQLSLLSNPQYKHPRYWATYVLLGNWL